MSKKCKTCNIDKAITDYYKDGTMRGSRSNICKSCTLKRHKARYVAKRSEILETQRIWRAANLDKERERATRFRNKHRDWYRKYHTKHRLKTRYGITLEQYEAMLEEQKGLCAICQKPETARNRSGEIKLLSLDHCHTSLKIRKLLCDNCNKGLGVFHDNVELLKRAVEYLEQHGPLLQKV